MDQLSLLQDNPPPQGVVSKTHSEAFSQEFEDRFLADLHSKASRGAQTVLVNSNVLALHLRRRLAEKHGGHSGVYFLTFLDVAKKLLRHQKPRLFLAAHLEPLLFYQRLPASVKKKAPVEEASRSSYFRSVLQSFHELVKQGHQSIPSASTTLKHLAPLYRWYLEDFLSEYYTRDSLLLEASKVSNVPLAHDLWVYGFVDFTAPQAEILQHARKHSTLHLYTPEPSANPKAKLQLHSSAHRMREIDEAVAYVLERLERTPLHKIAILFRNSASYEARLGQALQKALVPFFNLGGSAFFHTPMGKSLAAMLSYFKSAKKRSDMMRVLYSFPFSDAFLSEAGQAADWDAWLKQAFISNEKQLHSKRLDALAEALKKPEIKKTQLHLRKFFSTLSSLEKDYPSWPKLTSSLLEFFKTFGQGLDANTMRFFEDIQSVQSMGLRASWDHIHDLLQSRLLSFSISENHFQKGGVLVAPITSVQALRFDDILILGLNEGEFPKATPKDPILLDEDRRKIPQWTPSQSPKKERALLGLTVQSANVSLRLSYTRQKEASFKETPPSPFLREWLALAEQTTGSLFPWQNSLPPLHLQDYQKSVLLESLLSTPEEGRKDFLKKQLLHLPPHYNRFLEWTHERFSSNAWSDFDGLVMENQLEGTRFSASHLQEFSACAYRYYLRYVLKLQTLESPEELSGLRPLDRGILIHDILFRFFTQLKKQSHLPLKPQDLPALWGELLRLADTTFAGMEDRLPLRFPSLWTLEKHSMLRDLKRVITEESQEKLFTPEAFEVRFGMRTKSAEEDARYSTDQAVQIPLAGHTLSLYGQIDRVDLSSDKKRARVIDYKTGSLAGKKDDHFHGGQNLQLAVYLQALSVLFPDVSLEDSTGLMRSTSFDQSKTRASLSGQILNARKSEFHHLLSVVSNSVRRGLFPPNPGREGQNCRFCDYRKICGKGISRIFERKKEDPITASIFDLENIA